MIQLFFTLGTDYFTKGDVGACFKLVIKPYQKIEERYDRTALRTLIKTGLRTGTKAGTTGTVKALKQSSPHPFLPLMPFPMVRSVLLWVVALKATYQAFDFLLENNLLR